MGSWEARYCAGGLFGWVRFSFCGVKYVGSLVGRGPTYCGFSLYLGVVTLGLWMVSLVLFLSFFWLCLYRCECFSFVFLGYAPCKHVVAYFLFLFYD